MGFKGLFPSCCITAEVVVCFASFLLLKILSWDFAGIVGPRGEAVKGARKGSAISVVFSGKDSHS
jgi:hypothetical protein